MLVLSRKDGEQILVGDDVVIKVLSIAGGRVRVGIEAPRHVSIRRSELTPSNDHFHAYDAEHDSSLSLMAGTVH
jgi:carbon storage regulator CsrA